MKIAIIIAGIISLIVFLVYNVSTSKNADSDKTENKRVPLTTVEEAHAYIETNFKNSEETLWVANALNDNVGVNMSIILDKVIDAGYLPDGFEQKEGYRIYKYQKQTSHKN